MTMLILALLTSNNDYDSADADDDWDVNLLIPRMMSQTDRWAEAEAKKH